MIEWSDEQRMVRDAVRQFVDKEIKPNLEALEHGDLPPYDILRKMFRTFGMDAMARDGFKRRLGAAEPAPKGHGEPESQESPPREGGFTIIPIIELCRYCP